MKYLELRIVEQDEDDIWTATKHIPWQEYERYGPGWDWRMFIDDLEAQLEAEKTKQD